MPDKPTIIYTKTDEAPALATYSLLPILRAFTKPAGIEIEALERALAAHRARLLVVTPNFQNPTGATMPNSARCARIALITAVCWRIRVAAKPFSSSATRLFPAAWTTIAC